LDGGTSGWGLGIWCFKASSIPFTSFLRATTGLGLFLGMAERFLAPLGPRC